MKHRLLILALLSLLLSACASSSQKSSGNDTTNTATNSTASAETGATTGTAENVQTNTSDINNATNTQDTFIDRNSIYFERDQYIISESQRETIQQQATRIKSSNKVVTLEGNADERGSSEYNLALGEKRANSVRKSLEVLGVSAKQLKTVSFGEEKPKAACHEETCWKENRRVDFKD